MKSQLKEPVRIRQKKLKDNNISLYLDIYWRGIRKYEFLHLYLNEGKTKTERDKNRQTIQIANTIKDKRVLELQSGELDVSVMSHNIVFRDYYIGVAKSKNGKTMSIWLNNLKYMDSYDPHLRGKMFRQINRDWVVGYRDYLGETPLSINSRCLYYQKMLACIHQAVRDGVIKIDPGANVKPPKAVETERMYLTLPELKKLAKAPCRSPEVKRAFLFSCLTGLRVSDVRALTWGDIQRSGKYTRIIFRQKKTGGLEYLDISPEASSLLGDPDRGNVFCLPQFESVVNYYIRIWRKDAGITKNITFHSARHTFATLMLTIGTDLYTVSKLLGHKDIATTQIYAKVIDKNKQDAVSRIPDIFDKQRDA
ncbi:MAG: site-specific integrase [Prevotella sp.]|jgi:integrase|nr:site-specific integrase [Prevotella sp.]MCH3994839.1 site-specific integrase [Prevotella sp.]